MTNKNATASQTESPQTSWVTSGYRTLELESAGLLALITALKSDLSSPFNRAVDIMRQAEGRVIVTGMGKSGHVGQKTAATFASTGTPSYFVHPSEASHGDLGMITDKDIVLAFSWSGETVELSNLLDYAKRFAVPLISVTSRTESTLAQASEVALVLPRAKEACPHGLAPTTSTTMQLALGDALAIALLESRGFSSEDFKIFHPGGQLGANLQFVRDIMHGKDNLPLAHRNTVMSEALVAMTEKSFGCIGVTDDQGHLIGIFTDGDLRRNMDNNLLNRHIEDIMTRDPKTIAPDMLASAAMERLHSSDITALFVVEGTTPIGIVHIHDLLRAGIA